MLLDKLKISRRGKTFRVDIRRKYIVYILIRKNRVKIGHPISQRDRSTAAELMELKEMINANVTKDYLYNKFPEWLEWTMHTCNRVGLEENVDQYIEDNWTSTRQPN